MELSAEVWLNSYPRDYESQPLAKKNPYSKYRIKLNHEMLLPICGGILDVFYP